MRRLGSESERAYQDRMGSGFIARYLSGDAVLDIGYRGGVPDALPITENAIGVELDYPGYDGVRLPFPDESQDAVFASHCLEHIPDHLSSLVDWFRVLKIGGFLVLAVPHQYLYERKPTMPSRFNWDHKRFYTPASLLADIEACLPIDGYRIRSLRDNDAGFDANVAAELHPAGCYEIELVIEKITRPVYGARIGWSDLVHTSAQFYAQVLHHLVEATQNDRTILLVLLEGRDPPPFAVLKPLIAHDVHMLKELRGLLLNVTFDSAWYTARYPDVAAATAREGDSFARQHYAQNGYFEGRLPRLISSDHVSLYGGSTHQDK